MLAFRLNLAADVKQKLSNSSTSTCTFMMGDVKKVSFPSHCCFLHTDKQHITAYHSGAEQSDVLFS